MNKGIACTLSFIFGAAAGSAACFIYAQKKYEKKYQEEVAAVKEAFCTRLDDISRAKWEVELNTDGRPDDDPEIVVRTNNDSVVNRDDYEHPAPVDYTAYSTPKPVVIEAPKEIPKDRPYVIHPDDYGECGYERIELSYYADGVLAEFATDEEVDDIDDVVGVDSLKHIGEYEPDVVHVRNDRLKCDYEISLDPRDYAEVVKESYHY